MILSTDYTRSIFLIILLCTVNIKLITSSKCNRTPEGHGALQTPADGRFHVRILENTDKYTPGKTYTIKLEGIDAGQRSMPPVRHKFSGFMLVVEKKFNESGALDSTSSFGVFTLSHGDSFTKITCANMVTHTTTTPKSEIQVLWTAPLPGSGCVAFKATVIEHRDVWYMDDGPLTKEFCEEEQIVDDSLTNPNKCCACAEAKYELTFEGLWSRNTHPKDFPSNNWITKFSDIIGASHTIDYRFWRYGDTATDGLQQVAELGATKELESELKSERHQIRTIIKARGLAYPDVTGKTFSVFRVDPVHSLVSLVTMIDPSPDWFLGVSGLDLCLENCTWAESRIIDLYPWDAGTDSGPSYISPDQPTNPRDHIRRIRSDYPNDPRSPFYDPSGASMKPLARLYLSRQRLYESNCPENVDSDSSSESRNPCATDAWKDISRCDAECGKGTKQQEREYVNDVLARQSGCQTKLRRNFECYGHTCSDRSGEIEETTESSCELHEWSDWNACRPRCGNGTQTRTRKYKQAGARQRCFGEDLKETQSCFTSCSGETENIPDSGDGDEGQEPENEGSCEASDWSPDGPCSLTCGGGVRIWKKERLTGKCSDEELEEKRPCNTHKCEIPDFCHEFPTNEGCRSDITINKWFYNEQFDRCDVFTWSCGDHGNKFSTHEECMETCTGQQLEFQQSGGSQRKKGKGNRQRNKNRNNN